MDPDVLVFFANTECHMAGNQSERSS